ncbi:hypothetical protein LINPERHAP2_LOCUS19636, partial [Linum perenne]
VHTNFTDQLLWYYNIESKLFPKCLLTKFVVRHGRGKSENTSSNHSSDIVKGSVPPFCVPGTGDRQPLIDCLLLPI